MSQYAPTFYSLYDSHQKQPFCQMLLELYAPVVFWQPFHDAPAAMEGSSSKVSFDRFNASGGGVTADLDFCGDVL